MGARLGARALLLGALPAWRPKGDHAARAEPALATARGLASALAQRRDGEPRRHELRVGDQFYHRGASRRAGALECRREILRPLDPLCVASQRGAESAEILVEKNRHGPPGKVVCRFIPERMLWTNA
jgi:hypothetical protein